MNITETAACLAELGNEKRLSAFRYLIKKGKAGAPVGEIQKELGIPASTLSHHIAHLVKVGLLEQEVRHTINTVKVSCIGRNRNTVSDPCA